MSVVSVIHSEEDRGFVEKRLIRPLPALGFDRWLSAAMFPHSPSPQPVMASAMRSSAAFLVVVPASAAVTEQFCADVQAALTCSPPVIPVYLGKQNSEPPNPVLTLLQKLGGIDAKAAKQQSDPQELWSELARRLPPPTSVTSRQTAAEIAAPIGWNEDVFSRLLAEALGGHDDHRCDALVSALSRYVADGGYPYGDQHANVDLAALRKKRQFLLMRRYASAVIASGTTDFKVRRQYAQSLIELKEFDTAVSVLTPLIKETSEAAHEERFEARGLMGRLLKQRYLDAPNRRNGKQLTQAIDTYWSVFREDQENVRHGVNAASCILRAGRDGISAPSPKEARAIAKKILDVLARRQAKAKSKRLDVWDYATRVEALVDLGDFEKASKALDEYLVHPDMDAFEVSSTYRQFDELLQLAKDKKGRPLLDRLARAAERLRSGGLTAAADRGSTPMLVRVSDPNWAPATIPDLVIHSRLGTIVSVTGSDRTIKSLLKDPIVIGIEESRRSGLVECVRSVPFVRVAATYQGINGSFSEHGSGALVAIIDNGIDVLHEAFLDEKGHSRIIGIWDQQDTDTSSPPTPPTGFDFGRYHSQADIAGYVAQKKVPAALSRANDGHGTHVASIAAGRKAGDFAGGVAPEAQLLIVISGGDEPTGYSHAHLAALSFIKQTATALKKPVVVNLSQGMNAGAHDGRSLLELGFDAFSNRGTLPGVVVVKSAGNERGKRGHAKLTVPLMGADTLTWRCPPGPSRVRLELWWRSASEYRFQLKSPSGDASEWVDEKNPDVEGYFKKRGPFQLKLVKRHPDNGDNLLRIDADNGVSPVAPSDWTLAVRAVRVSKNGDIHAWIERGGLAQAEFVDNHDNEDMTLSIPGTSDSVITVSAIDPDAETIDGVMSIMVGKFSSFGPTRDLREKPDIAAPGVKIKAARRDSTNGVIEMDGTSMAAPHVTGAIALLLSKVASAGQECPTATQIAAVLREKTINYNGDWDRGQGYGVLDVAALLGAF